MSTVQTTGEHTSIKRKRRMVKIKTNEEKERMTGDKDMRELRLRAEREMMNSEE